MSNSGGVVQGSGRKSGAGQGAPTRFFVRSELEKRAALAEAEVAELRISLGRVVAALEGAEAKLAEALKKQVRYFSPWTGFVVGRDGIRPLEWLVGKGARQASPVLLQVRRLASSGAQCASLWQKAACWEPGRGESFFARTFKRMMVWRDLDALFIEETGGEYRQQGAAAGTEPRGAAAGTEPLMAPGVYFGLVKSGRGRPRPYWIFVGDGQ